MILISGGWNKVIQMTNKEKKDASGYTKVNGFLLNGGDGAEKR